MLDGNANAPVQIAQSTIRRLLPHKRQSSCYFKSILYWGTFGSLLHRVQPIGVSTVIADKPTPLRFLLRCQSLQSWESTPPIVGDFLRRCRTCELAPSSVSR